MEPEQNDRSDAAEPAPAESPVERQIRAAMARGEFDDLPGAGKPLPGAGESYDPLWWVRSWIERERLKDARRPPGSGGS